MAAQFEMKHSQIVSTTVGVEAAREKPNWKPLAFNPIYLLFLAILHILSIVGIQILSNKQASDHEELDHIRANRTGVSSPDSTFVFDEGNTVAFVAWAYLPVAIVMVIAAFWEILDLQVRRLEPFHQLSSPEGGNVWNALCLDYTSLFGLFTPFMALRRGHYVVSLTSGAFVLISIVLPAMSGSIFSVEWGSLSFSSGRAEGSTYAIVEINTGVAIASQVLHGILCAVALVLLVIIFRRRTGLYRDPKGIGGLVSLISDTDRSGLSTLQLFHQIPSFAHSDAIYSSLRHVTFRLEHVAYYNADGSTSTAYQLTADAPLGHALPITPEQRGFYRSRRDSSGLWLTKRMAWASEILLWLGQASVTTALYYTAKILTVGSLPDDARLTISKVVLTLCITVGGMMWVSIQRNLQVFETWRQLSSGRSRALYASLARPNAASLGVIGGAMLSMATGSIITLWAAFCVLMIQAITVVGPPLLEVAYASGLMGNMADYRHIGVIEGKQGQALVITGIAIHIAIFLNLVFLMLNGRTRPFLPRAPTTLASQIAYLCRSDRLLFDFAGSSMLSEADLNQRLKNVERRCLFGWHWWRRGQAWYVGLEESEQGEPWQAFSYVDGIQRFNPCT